MRYFKKNIAKPVGFVAPTRYDDTINWDKSDDETINFSWNLLSFLASYEQNLIKIISKFF